MLQFFKKTGRRQKDANISTIDSIASSSSSPSSSANQQNNLLIKHENNNELCQQQQQQQRKLQLQKHNQTNNVNTDELLLEAEKYYGITSSSTNVIDEQENQDEDHTNFSKSILQIITDTNCLSYFIQYLEQEQSLPLIKFWLDSESFKQSIVTVFQNNNNNNNNNNNSNNSSIYDLSLIETKLKDELTKLLLLNSKNPVTERSKMSKSFSLDIAAFNYDKKRYDTVSEMNSFDIQEQQQQQQLMENDDTTGDILVDNGNASNDDNNDHDDDHHNVENGTASNVATTILDHIQNDHDVTDFCRMEQRPITDDEKSQIYEQNKSFINKQQQHENQQFESQQNDTDIEFQLSIATDAIRIIRKYFIKNSLYSIDIPSKWIKSMLAKLNSNESIDASSEGGIGSRQSLNDCDLNENNSDDVIDQVLSTNNNNNNTIGDDSKTKKIPLINKKIINLFTDAQMFIITKLDEYYLNAFLESTFYYKFTLDILTSDNLRMIDILQNETAIFYFMEFLDQEEQQKRHYLEFWIAAMNFHKQFYMKLNSIRNVGIADMMVEAAAAATATATTTTIIDGDSNNNLSIDDEKEDNKSNGTIIKATTTTTTPTPDSDMKEIQSDALILYEKYFSLQANENHSLHLSDRIRFTIEEKICSNNPRTMINCFNVSMKVIEYYLENKYLLKFKTSTLFYKYLSELLQRVGGSVEDQQHTIDKIEQLKSTKQQNKTLSLLTKTTLQATANKQRQYSHRKTYSDCTSDNTQALRRSSTTNLVDDHSKQQQHQLNNNNNNNSFLSSQNTLLAMDSKYYNKNNQRKKQITSSGTSSNGSSSGSNATATATDMQIDSRQLYNPDLLWRRNTIAGLSFGRIDSLGRYERDFDWDPLHNNGDNRQGQQQQHHPHPNPSQITANATSILQSKSNKFKRAVRKLVNLPEDKVQEEMAWQVAEMIIKDITNVTLNNHDNNNYLPSTTTTTMGIDKKINSNNHDNGNNDNHN